MKTKSCFIVMPFSAELNFFYLYIQKYLKEKHGINVERGDHQILTKPIMDKVRDQILAADVIIGEVTGGNPNVFYELGIANAFGKPIVYITRDKPESSPVDIRQFEHIHYDLSNHVEFLSKVDNAILNVFVVKYQDLYSIACSLLQEFNEFSGTNHLPNNLENFQAQVMRGESTEGLPDQMNRQKMIAFFIPKVFDGNMPYNVMTKLTAWIETFTESI